MRVALVWEGVCALPPEEPATTSLRDRYRRFRDRGGEVNWERVVRSWQIMNKPLQRIYSLSIRDIPVDMITYLGEEYCDALRDYLDHLLISVARVEYFESPEHFARSLRIAPDIQYVVDSDPERLKVYGRRGLEVTIGEDWGMFI